MGAETFVTVGTKRTKAWRFEASDVVRVTLGTVAVVVLLQLPHSPAIEVPLSSWIMASFGKSRPVEARLTGGLPWAAFRSASSAMNVVIAPRADVHRDAYPLRHASAIAQLLSGRHREALATLVAAAASSKDARVWNDLAAAYHAAAARYDAPELLADALGAVDTALSLDARLAEARFNRALILQHFGFRDAARDAWNDHLRIETDGAWIAEATLHRRSVAPVLPFRQVLDRESMAIAGDAATAADFVRRHPEDSRTQGSIEVLKRWAAAEMSGDQPRAAMHLDVARALGIAIAAAHGDRMLERSVAAIEQTTRSSRRALASAHLDYSNGIETFWDNRPSEAEPVLRRAAAALERAGSPLHLMATYSVANTVFDQSRREEAKQLLESALAATPPDFPACRAHVLSQLGAYHFTVADWGASLGALLESAKIFEGLGEISNTSAVRRLIAIIYDQNGDRENAWSFRMAALRGLGRESSLRLEKAISSIAQEAMLRRNWRSAFSFLTLEIETARRIDDDVHLAETFLFRSVVRHRLHDLDGAAADLAESRAIAAGVADGAYRAQQSANELFVRSIVEGASFDATAILEDAIAFESVKGDRMVLPRLLLQRARALRAAGDAAGAEADLDRAMSEMERQRQSIPTGDARWGAFAAAEDVFQEAIDLALDLGNVAKAFATAERSRGRSILETFSAPPSLEIEALPAGTVIVEYALLPSRVAIFTVQRSGIAVTLVSVESDGSTAEIAALQRLIRGNDQAVASASAALYRRYIEPVAAHLAGATDVIFVPDGAMTGLPFGALVNGRGEYLIDRYNVVVAPSAAVFAAASRRRLALDAPDSVLVVANATGDAESPALPQVRAEAAAVKRLYGTSIESDDDAQYSSLVKLGPGAAAIHFGGHAIGDVTGLEPASILLREGGRSRRVRVREIAAMRLQRTSVVVLAGCSTGQGERRGPEGVISVANGFLAAGAPSVVATLWPIDDGAAATLFPRLHEYLSRGVTPARALREVQLEAIRERQPASAWAALFVTGSGTTGD